MLCAPLSSLSLGPWVLLCLKIHPAVEQATPPSRPAASKLSRNALAESTVWKPSPEIKHLFGDSIIKRRECSEADGNYDFFPSRRSHLASRWDDNDREGIWCWKCLEVLGVALSCAGEMRSMKPLRIICVIQIQQAFLEGVDSVEPCREAVWRHQDQLMLGAQRRLGPRRTTLSL